MRSVIYGLMMYPGVGLLLASLVIYYLDDDPVKRNLCIANAFLGYTGYSMYLLSGGSLLMSIVSGIQGAAFVTQLFFEYLRRNLVVDYDERGWFGPRYIDVILIYMIMIPCKLIVLTGWSYTTLSILSIR